MCFNVDICNPLSDLCINTLLSLFSPLIHFLLASLPSLVLFFFSRLLPDTQSLPLFVTSSSPCLAPCRPNPPVKALSWIKLSPILSLYGRIYSSSLSYPPFSTLVVASTVTRLCSLESIKFSCSMEGNPRRTLKISDKHQLGTNQRAEVK